MTLPNAERVGELQQSAQQLAKQALDTAELGLRLVRAQLEQATGQQSPQVAAFQRNLQDNALAAETKAKELFTLATRFMNDLNDKWQPGQAAAAAPAEAAEEAPPTRTKVDIG
ncbi:MAG: hypothetical protein VKP62_01090 [Candidatus Sericytochromatia bacterium]|nr:hypothetical protein [Candidatus Sericytochromatia bacterium]